MTVPAFVSNVALTSIAGSLSTSHCVASDGARCVHNASHLTPTRTRTGIANGGYRLGWHGQQQQHGRRCSFERRTIRSCMNNPSSSSSSSSSSSTDPARPSSFTIPTTPTTNNKSNPEHTTSDSNSNNSVSDSDDVEVLDTDLSSLNINLPNTPPSITDADRDLVDTMASDSAQLLDATAATIRNDLDSVAAANDELADRLIEEETRALLDKFEERQRELLNAVARERDVIQGEVEALQSGELFKKEDGKGEKKTKREILLQGVMVLFGIGAASYGVNAVMSADGGMMRNALVDAGVAVCASLLLSSSTSSSKETEADDL